MTFALGSIERLIASKRERTVAVWTFMFLPILTTIFAFDITYGYKFYENGDHDAYKLNVLIVNYITLVFVLFVYSLIALLWKEPEIDALHKGFVTFSFIFALCVPIARIVAMERPIPAYPDGSGAQRLGHGLYVFLQCFANQCTLIGCLVLRQRIFYEVYVKFNLRPSFWLGVPVFLLICLGIAVPYIACSYTLDCNAKQQSSVFYAMMVCLGALFAFYLYHTYQGHRVFVQFYANLRAFILHNVSQIVFFALVMTETANVGILEQLTSPYFVWLICLDTFTFPIIKAFLRKYTTKIWFEDIDVYGATYRALSNVDQFEHHIISPQLYPSFQEYADDLFAGENVLFLHEVALLRIEETTTGHINLKKRVNEIMEKFLSPRSSYQINICDTTYQKAHEFYRDDTWIVLDDIFKRAELEIRTNLLLGIWPSYQSTKQYQNAVCKLDASNPSASTGSTLVKKLSLKSPPSNCISLEENKGSSVFSI